MPDDCAKPEVPGAKAPERSCPVCAEALRLRRVIRCSACKTLHHLECWRFNKGCATYGCGSRSWEDAPGAEFAAMPREFPRSAGMTAERGMSVGGGVLAGYALVGTIALMSQGNVAPGMLTALACGFFGTLVVRYGIGREHLELNERTGGLDWRWELFGRPLRRRAGWLAFADVVELHLHTSGARGAMLTHALYALLRDGTRRRLYTRVGEGTERAALEVEQIADHLSRLADCTVRRIQGNTAPTLAEMQEAIAQRQLAAPAVPQPAVPAISQPAAPAPDVLVSEPAPDEPEAERRREPTR